MRLSFPVHPTFRFAIFPFQPLRDNDLLLAHLSRLAVVHTIAVCRSRPEIARAEGFCSRSTFGVEESRALVLRIRFTFAGMAGGLRLFLTVPPTTAYSRINGTVPPTTAYTRINGVEKVQKVHKRVHGGYNIRAATAPGQGGGVLDRPTLDKPTPGRESEFDLKRKKKTSPPYRVMLHNDNFNKREYVVQVLMKAIPGMTVDIAVNVMNEAHINGLAVVIVCPQEDAEDYCMQLRTNGLLSSIEPDSC